MFESLRTNSPELFASLDQVQSSFELISLLYFVLNSNSGIHTKSSV